MTRITCVAVLAAAVASAPGLLVSAQTPSGRELMEEQIRRHAPDTEYSESTILLVDERGREKERRVVTYTRRGDDGLTQSLLKFLEPADIRVTGLLTWEQPADREDDQWLYLPATRSAKRISGASKKQLFMGTDLAYEDLRAESLDAHEYRVLREEPLDGEACWVIEATPATDKEKRDSGYSKRVFWVRQDVHLTVKVEFYDRAGKLDKVGTLGDLVQVEGDMWRANRSVIERTGSNTRTVWGFQKREVNGDLDETLFTQQGLSRPAIAR
jgi:hypothetical protein